MTVSRALTLAALLLLALPGTALAADAGEPVASLRPVTVTAGEGRLAALVTPVPVIGTDAVTRTATVRVDNVSELPEIVHLEVIDYVLDAAGKAVAPPAGYPTGSAAWYHLSETDFLLPSGSSIRIPLSVTPPATAAAGDHSAALNVVVRADPDTLPHNGGVAAETVLVFQVRLQHRIPGAVPEAPVVSLHASPDGGTVHFAMSVRNSGNTVLGYQADPLARLDLYNVSPWGDPTRPERTLTSGGFYVAPSSERLVRIDWTDAPLVGTYRALVTLPGIDGLPAVTAETTFTTVNLPLLGAIVAMSITLLLSLFAMGVRPRRRRARVTLSGDAEVATPRYL